MLYVSYILRKILKKKNAEAHRTDDGSGELGASLSGRNAQTTP